MSSSQRKNAYPSPGSPVHHGSKYSAGNIDIVKKGKGFGGHHLLYLVSVAIAVVLCPTHSLYRKKNPREMRTGGDAGGRVQR